MTENLYQVDSYLKSFQAVVVAVDEASRAILLDRSAFYPGGGGQPFDTGSVSFKNQQLPLLRSRKSAEGVWHLLGGESPLPPVGEAIQAEIDWPRRYSLMRTHTAMHILCGVVFRDFGAQVTGGDMEALDGRMDFEFETMTRELVSVIEEAVNREVQAARAVRTKILPREEAFQIPDLIRTKINLLPAGIEFVRTVEIVGLDLQADGGTHVHNTSEVGRMRIADYKSKGKINKRIYVRLEE
ncbi:MAG: alanyl-tRNA editing protein [Anaerolineaceae bacterium]|nr:alanyl-tRNA editing protein [Anaerolineaceae bacterium]